MPPTNILMFNQKNTLHPILQSLSTEYSIQLLSDQNPKNKPISLVNERHNLMVVDATEKLPFEGLAFAKIFRESLPPIQIVIFTQPSVLEISLMTKL